MTIDETGQIEDTEIVSQFFGPNKQEIEYHIENNDQAELMRVSFFLY